MTILTERLCPQCGRPVIVTRRNPNRRFCTPRCRAAHHRSHRSHPARPANDVMNDVPVPSPFADYVTSRLDQAVDPNVFVGNLGGGRALSAPTPETELLRNLGAYRAVGVAYVLTPAGHRLPAGFTLAFRSPTTWIYRLVGADPVVTAPGCALAASEDSAQLACSRQTRLVARETALPGSHATLDGRRVHLRGVDGVFQALSVGPGSHHVTFWYSPPFLDWALAAFAVGCAALLLDLFARIGGNRKRT